MHATLGTCLGELAHFLKAARVAACSLHALGRLPDLLNPCKLPAQPQHPVLACVSTSIVPCTAPQCKGRQAGFGTFFGELAHFSKAAMVAACSLHALEIWRDSPFCISALHPKSARLRSYILC